MTNLHYLTGYAHFNQTNEMDQATDKHIQRNWDELNDTDKAVLNMIKCYSAKFRACHLKHSTIEKATGKSNSTIRRTLVKLERLGIIKRHKTIRRVLSGYGANIYAILPFVAKKEQNEQSNMNTRQGATKVDTSTTDATNSKKKHFSYKSITNLVTNTYHAESSLELPQSFYSRFKSLVGSFITNGQQLTSKLYGIYRAQSIKLMRFDIHKNKGDQFQQLAIQAINITMQATKKQKIRSITGYYSGVLQRLINKALFDDVRELHSEPVQFVIGSDKHEVNAMRDRLKHRQRLQTFDDMTLPF